MAKSEALKLRDQLQNKFGEKTVIMGSDMPQHPRISTGSLSLDLATGVGGWPSDRLVEVFGAEQCGKTTLGLMGMSNFLDAQPKRHALILDTEHKLEMGWLETLVGADRLANRVIYIQPDDIEQACEIYKDAVKSGLICFCLFDSIASAQTRKSVETDKDEMTGNAKAMARFAPIMAQFSAKYQCLTYAVNQTRDDIAGFHRVITPGGHAPKHNAIMRVYLKKGKGEVFEDTASGEKIRIGYVVSAKIVKNQAGGMEGRTCQYWFMSVPTEKWGFGVDQLEEISRLGVITGVVERKGGWYYHEKIPGGKIQGADQFAAFVKGNPEVQKELREAITARIPSYVSQIAPVTNSDDEMPVGEIFKRDPFDD